eukprot:COSAG03_NODE_431_length_7966_cov_4.105123_7_plen_194_part_01
MCLMLTYVRAPGWVGVGLLCSTPHPRSRVARGHWLTIQPDGRRRSLLVHELQLLLHMRMRMLLMRMLILMHRHQLLVPLELRWPMLIRPTVLGSPARAASATPACPSARSPTPSSAGMCPASRSSAAPCWSRPATPYRSFEHRLLLAVLPPSSAPAGCQSRADWAVLVCSCPSRPARSSSLALPRVPARRRQKS